MGRNHTRIAAAGALLLAACAAPRPAPARFEFARRAMGTAFRLVLYGRDATRAREAAEAAFGEIERVEACLSDWRPDSEIRRLREGEQRVSATLFEVLEASQRFAALTDGAFDVTVGPLVDLWRRGRVPDDADRRAALESVGWRHLALDPADRTVRLERPGMRLDVGGIAKGWVADRALGLLARRGIRTALVDAGGDLALGDAPPDRAGWRVEIGDEARAEILLSNCGVAASGGTERFVEAGGRRYSHILDPRTGMGLEDVALVTVVAPDATTADALATALSVLPADEGLRLARALEGVAVYRSR